MKLNPAFWKWFGDSKVVDADGNPLVVYHGTSANFRKFNTKKSTQGIIWFSSDRDKIVRGGAGAAGRNRILELVVSMQRPAGWKAYEKLLLSQLRREYDGAILPDGDGGFDGFVFDPTQLKSVDNDGTWDADDASIRSNPHQFDDDFWDWFGDSKVIDSKGNPLIVYHATGKKFTKFRDGPTFFTTNVDEAREYLDDGHNGKGYILKCYLRIENPGVAGGEDEIANSPYNKKYIGSLLKNGHDGLVAYLPEYDATYFVTLWSNQVRIDGYEK